MFTTRPNSSPAVFIWSSTEKNLVSVGLVPPQSIISMPLTVLHVPHHCGRGGVGGGGLLGGDGCEAGRPECLTLTNAESFPFVYGAEKMRYRHVSDTYQQSRGACFFFSYVPRLQRSSIKFSQCPLCCISQPVSLSLPHLPSLSAPTVSRGAGSKVASSIASPRQEIQEAPGIFPDWVTFFFSFICLFLRKTKYHLIYISLTCFFLAVSDYAPDYSWRLCLCYAAKSSASCLLSLNVDQQILLGSSFASTNTKCIVTIWQWSTDGAVHLHGSSVVAADESRSAVVLTEPNLEVWIFPDLSTWHSFWFSSEFNSCFEAAEACLCVWANIEIKLRAIESVDPPPSLSRPSPCLPWVIFVYRYR